MSTASGISCLFVDIGGVLLTNGWDHVMRAEAAERFGLDLGEMQERHHLTFATYEEGRLTLDEYLRRTVFYEKRSFTPDEFRMYMFEQSKPYPEMLGLLARLKAAHGLKVVAVSNEGRELSDHRMGICRLSELVDVLVSSSYVRMRKPDAEIYRLALDISMTSPEQVIYLENTAMFVQVAEGLGIRSILHQDYEATRLRLASLGLHD